MGRNSADRTEANTPASINERIRRATEASVTRAVQGGPAAIEARLRALDREWDTERLLQAMASTATLTGLGLGLGVNRKWFAIPGIVSGFLLLHALQGWCPPLPVIRALGVRTPGEIDEERYALKAARGDFSQLANGSSTPRALLAAATR